MIYRDRLPVLELELATPCPARWEAMHGDDRVRHCDHCDRKVYNLAALNRDEAEALIYEHEGRLCVRYFQRFDGTVILRDCSDWLRIRPSAEQVLLWVLLILAGSVALLVVAMQCARGSSLLGSVG